MNPGVLQRAHHGQVEDEVKPDFLIRYAVFLQHLLNAIRPDIGEFLAVLQLNWRCVVRRGKHRNGRHNVLLPNPGSAFLKPPDIGAQLKDDRICRNRKHDVTQNRRRNGQSLKSGDVAGVLGADRNHCAKIVPNQRLARFSEPFLAQPIEIDPFLIILAELTPFVVNRFLALKTTHVYLSSAFLI